MSHNVIIRSISEAEEEKAKEIVLLIEIKEISCSFIFKLIMVHDYMLPKV